MTSDPKLSSTVLSPATCLGSSAHDVAAAKAVPTVKLALEEKEKEKRPLPQKLASTLATRLAAPSGLRADSKPGSLASRLVASLFAQSGSGRVLFKEQVVTPRVAPIY